ncbi:efflux RND transporter periplasmic adaptor subunit [Desulfovibrio intestinalis]|uniref:Multidrug efflux system membrane fusion protein n=1 Tax=Desulfovibrio intestinalis TaxID=58621 RepID=A0A7W8BZ58_9BACT|nr:efflux RND transporter periplasmic adaptor subunit [Desulfovibrio intestinalis]MBB5142612.1 multidrug efflux system membrane fusion protein [Desulfovibrio intestinalis]
MTPFDNRLRMPFFSGTAFALLFRGIASKRLVLLALTLALLPALNGCLGNDQKASGPPPAPVRTATVDRADVPRLLHVVGNVRASASVGVRPRVAGEIQQVHFTEGQDVQEGQPLITIDPRPFAAILREKRGMLAKSQAQLNKALDDMARYGKLVGDGYVSREAYEQTATQAAALRATVQSDKAAEESAALDLAYCTVVAPISGRVGALSVDKGNMVKSSDATPIVTIDTLSPIYVGFSVPEAHLPIILDRMAVESVTVTATPTGAQPEQGVLTLVDNTVDTRTGTIRLRATFENADRHLWPGQFVQVELPLGMGEQVLTVPSRAVQSGRDESYVYVVDKDNHAAYRAVKPLFEHKGVSVVEGSLAEGEQVVIEGQVRLAPGLPVKVVE